MTVVALAAYATAEILEQALGDPLDAQNLFSFQHQMALDEDEAFPEEICDFLYHWGLVDQTKATDGLCLDRTLTRR